MIISNTICTRWVGKEGYSLDRIASPFIISIEAYLLTGSWQVCLITGIAFALWRYDGWGEQFLVMHGEKKHYDNRNTNKIITKIADFIYSSPPTQQARKRYGILWGGLRGLYDMIGFLALSIVLGNHYVMLAAPLMAAQGYIYYLVGNYIKQDTAYCEYALGFYRGLLWMGAFLYAGF